jgi:hypothetical protein
MAYTPLPPVPNRPTGSPEQFSQSVYLFMNALPTFGTDMQGLFDDTVTQNGIAKAWATQLTSEVVAGQGYSARQYAINSGEFALLSKNWATYLSGEVETGNGYSAKYYAQESNTSASLSKDWATYIGSEVVSGQGYSSRQYAINSSEYATLSQNWANLLGSEVVIGQGYSAKYYAQVAQAAVATLPDGTINDALVSTLDTWSSQNLNHIVTAATSMATSNNDTATYINGLFP